MIDVSLVVLSCDKNEWLLHIFFELFERYWKECPYEVYVSTESKKIGANIPVQNINCNEEVAWSGRLKYSLEIVNTDYVLLMLDDFLIEENVNQVLLNEYVEWLKEKKGNNIVLTTVEGEKSLGMECDGKLVRRDRFGRYKTSLQCGLWDRKVLLSLLDKQENAWEFELFGNCRSFVCDNTFFALTNKCYKPIVYNEGFFVVQGKVNMPEKRRIEQKTGIEINIDDHPSFEENMVRDNIRFIPRVLRRLKIIVLYLRYRVGNVMENR